MEEKLFDIRWVVMCLVYDMKYRCLFGMVMKLENENSE